MHNNCIQKYIVIEVRKTSMWSSDQNGVGPKCFLGVCYYMTLCMTQTFGFKSYLEAKCGEGGGTGTRFYLVTERLILLGTNIIEHIGWSFNSDKNSLM